MKYKFISHTADVKIHASGNTLEEAFSNSLIGFTKFISKDKIKPKENKKIKVTGIDIKNLLYNFIEEFIILFDSEYFLLSKIEEIKIKNLKGKFSIECNAWGDSGNNYKILSGIKAITYNEMEIKKIKNKYEIIFTLDI
ncbi:archease [Candidatus Woesearchaeota archaeon]|nr:archease [Candidatus Woesearchaeota archaeon]